VKPRLVLSGVNLIEGGALAIFRDALEELSANWSDRFEIVALVHDRRLFEIPRVGYLEFPTVKRSWLRRLRFEYIDCRRLSRTLQPHLWFAMHDMTPDVTASIRAVYCHNPAPFYRMSPSEVWRDWKLALFRICYARLYRFNLKKNHFVVVQQQWLRSAFESSYGTHRTIVAHPHTSRIERNATGESLRREQPHRFFYPAYPRSPKNLETLLEAVRIVEERGIRGFEVWITLDGTENGYARRLHARFRDLLSVRWLGLISRERVFALYAEASCLIFPSKLETWGMPISEFRQTGKPMFLADLPYAHETAGSYPRVHFFDPRDANALATALCLHLDGALALEPTTERTIAEPFAEDWNGLFRLLLGSPTCA
jgi:glycosyltransferase involved in cell wall biosynthesis